MRKIILQRVNLSSCLERKAMCSETKAGAKQKVEFLVILSRFSLFYSLAKKSILCRAALMTQAVLIQGRRQAGD